MKQPYNIVCVSDESYIQHTAVMLCSLFETNKNNIFHIYLLTPDVSQVSRQRLTALCKYYGSKYNPQIEMFARFKMKSSFHKTKRII